MSGPFEHQLIHHHFHISLANVIFAFAFTTLHNPPNNSPEFVGLHRGFLLFVFADIKLAGAELLSGHWRIWRGGGR
jgi:hypothetical protein